MHFLYLNIFNKICCHNNQLILIPDLNEPIDDESFGVKIESKVQYEYESTIDSCGAAYLMLVNKTLIEDLKNDDLFLIFVVAYSRCFEKNPENMWFEPANPRSKWNGKWDEKLTIDELHFLGWTINDVYGDSASTDGVFPIKCFIKNINIVDKEAINEWGLINNEKICDKYIQENETNTALNVADGLMCYDYDWEKFAIYCDKYTYNKLQKLYKSLNSLPNSEK